MKPRTIIGIVLIVAGAWKLANMWGIIENDWLWRQPWTTYIAPAALIYVGALVIVNSYRRDPDQWLQRPLPIGEDGKRICCSVHYGGDEYIYRGEPLHGARLDALCGGIRMDLRNAVMSFIHERITGASSMVNGLNVILKLILYIYTTYEIVGNDVKAVGILFCCS